MTNRMIIAGVTLLMCASCSLSERYSIKGTVNTKELAGQDSLSWVAISSNGEDSVLFSTPLHNGTFESTFKTPLPDVVFLKIAKQRVPVFFEAAIKGYEIDLDSAGIRTKGGSLQAAWQDYRDLHACFNAKKDSVEQEYRKEVKADNLFGKMHQMAVYNKLEQTQKEAEDSLLKSNDNVVAATILHMQTRKLLMNHTLIKQIALLGEKALQTSPGKALKLQEANLDRLERENIAPDFTQDDPEGKPVSLYGIQAKVKILDFWASWCGPCRAETPNVKRIYDNYKRAGLEIISVSLDTKKESWLQAIEKDKMNWIHTSDLKGWKNEAAQRYGVKSIPAIFVLDSDNHIIGKNLRGEKLEEVVKEAIAK